MVSCCAYIHIFCSDTADGSALRSSSRKNVQIKEPTTKGSATSTPIPSQTSQKFVESNKLEDQINLQHLVELMRIFHVSAEIQQIVSMSL